MVNGLELFRAHFSEYNDRYVLIGGTACDLIMSNVGLRFRATKDLDIVLCLERLDAAFARAFWGFVASGGYELRETAAGRRIFYRLRKPEKPQYPAMLELFSRMPDALSIAEGSHLTPIPINEQISSLSAILLDDSYYGWIHAGKTEIDGVPIVGPEYLVPLKAKAWLDLSARADAGDAIDSRSIRKHRNDVFRLSQVIDPVTKPHPPALIVRDMRSFLDQMATERVDLKALGLRSRSLDDVLEGLRTIYSFD